MANTTIAISNMYGGVSRQADTVRHFNQVQEADNAIFTIKDGLSKRPGTEAEFACDDLTVDAEYRLHTIYRDEEEEYLVIYGVSGELYVFDTDGNEYRVLKSADATTYLSANEPDPSEIRLTTIADYTILVNRTVEASAKTSDPYLVTDEWKDFDVILSQTPAVNTYHRAKKDVGAYPPGYWKYTPGTGTFPTIVFDEAAAYWGTKENYEIDATNPGGFKIAFIRKAMVIAGGAYVTDDQTLTKADAFADYTWHEGDQIYLSGGTDIVAAWYTIASKTTDHEIILEASAGTSDNADTTTTNIGIYCTVTFQGAQEDFADMHKVASMFQDEARKTFGLEDVLIGWTDTGLNLGYFTITGPWRGENSTLLVTEAPAADYDHTLTTRGFSKVGGEYTITAGTGSVNEDTLPPIDRWTQQVAPGQALAAMDATTMPVQMVRSLPGNDTYRDNIMADTPFAYWRLGDLALIGTGDGLTGNYYDVSDFTAHFATRIDTTVDFDWGWGAPIVGMGSDYFSIRWTGQVNPEFSETYTFFLDKDAGAILWVNDVLVIDAWEAVAEEVSGTIALTAATRYNIRIDYRERVHQAVCHLKWSSASQAKQVIPQARLYSAVGSGTSAIDETEQNDGTYVGAPTQGLTGAIANDSDTSVTFNGSSQYVNLGTLGNFGEQMEFGVTVEAWIKTASVTLLDVFGAQNNNDSASGIFTSCLLQLGPDRIQFYVAGQSGKHKARTTGDIVCNDDNWHHIAASWNPIGDIIRIYMDGERLEIANVVLDTIPLVPSSFSNFTIDVYIGASNTGNVGAERFFDGEIDEVAIYNRTLSNATVFQHYLFGTSDDTVFFRLDTIDWVPRYTGDQNTNPVPSIIENNSKISDVAFHRNRFAIVGDENIVFSQAGDFFNFFIEDADNLADADPIDAALTSSQVTIVDSVVEFKKALIIFTKAGRQFELNAPEVLTPETAAITASTAYNSIIGVKPQMIGIRLYFPAKQEGTTQLREYFYSDSEASNSAANVSSHCDGYLPDDIQTIATTLNEDIVLILPPATNQLYYYRAFWQGEDKVQSAWSRFIFDTTERIADIATIGDRCYLLIENDDGFFVASMRTPGAVAESDWACPIHLDSQEVSLGTYAAGTGLTTWAHLIYDETIDSVVLGPDFGDDEGTVLTPTVVDANTITVVGDYSAGNCIIGRGFTMSVELSRPYMRSRDGAAILDATMRLNKLVTNHTSTGGYDIRIKQPDRDARDYSFAPRDGSLLETEGNSQAIIMGCAKDAVISIRNTTPLPSTISNAEFVTSFVQRAR